MRTKNQTIENHISDEHIDAGGEHGDKAQEIENKLNGHDPDR